MTPAKSKAHASSRQPGRKAKSNPLRKPAIILAISSSSVTRKKTNDIESDSSDKGSVCLNLSNKTAAALLQDLQEARQGLTGNPNYPEIPAPLMDHTVETITSLTALQAHQQALECELKSVRAALAGAVTEGKDCLRQLSISCQSFNSNPAALVSAGWTLRRAPGPTATMPVPERIQVRPTAFPGALKATWKAVPNKRFYQIQAGIYLPGTDRHGSEDQALLCSTTAAFPFDTYPLGYDLTFRVRAYGAKGPGPWSTWYTTPVR